MKYAKDDAGREKLLSVIQQDVTRLDRLVTDISNASRLDRELVRDERASFDLSQLITNLVEFNQQHAEKQGGKLTMELPDEPLFISGLEGRLAQVLVNLISNAISFIGEDGEVRVKASFLPADPNIRPEGVGLDVPPQGARFVLELPV